MNHHVTTDLNEGRHADVGCLNCHEERATIGVATPPRMYVAALYCDLCGEALVEYDVFSGRAA
jgi:hypothetical protein